LARGLNYAIEANILHGIVPPIASPQFQIINRRYRCYQRISQFNAVALTELFQIFPSLPCNLQVDGRTWNRCKKSIQNLTHGLTRTVPELGDRNREQEGRYFPGLNQPIWRESLCLCHPRLQLISESIRTDFVMSL
jgi:hypothetical protein